METESKLRSSEHNSSETARSSVMNIREKSDNHSSHPQVIKYRKIRQQEIPSYSLEVLKADFTNEKDFKEVKMVLQISLDKRRNSS